MIGFFGFRNVSRKQNVLGEPERVRFRLEAHTIRTVSKDQIHQVRHFANNGWQHFKDFVNSLESLTCVQAAECQDDTAALNSVTLE